jgi:hypothetical protein
MTYGLGPWGGLLADIVKAEFFGFRRALASVVVFGSVARGEDKQGSDVDVFVTLREPILSRGRASLIFRERYRASLSGVRQAGRRISTRMVPVVTYDGIEAAVVADRVPLSFIFRGTDGTVLSPLYFSLADCSLVLYDRGGTLRRALNTVRLRMNRLGFERLPVHGGSYWRPGGPLSPADLEALGFDEKGSWFAAAACRYLRKARSALNGQDLPRAIAMWREVSNALLKASLSFCGIEPVKCDGWETAILRREASFLCPHSQLVQFAVILALDAQRGRPGLRSRSRPPETAGFLRNQIIAAERVLASSFSHMGLRTGESSTQRR